MNIAIIGKNAYLAQNIQQVFINHSVTLIDRLENIPNISDLTKYDVVINFSIQPSFKTVILGKDELIDIQIANILKDSNVTFVMLSSRKVYGSYDDLMSFSEEHDLHPIDCYGKNKVLAEKEVEKILHNKCLILRISNILDLPTNKKDYSTFVGWIGDSIRNKGMVYVTENGNVKKDFITRYYLQKAMLDLINTKQCGIFNVGAGWALTLRELLEKIVGVSNIVFSEPEPVLRDQFLLNVDKLHKYVNPFTKKDIVSACVNMRNSLFLDVLRGNSNVKD